MLINETDEAVVIFDYNSTTYIIRIFDAKSSEYHNCCVNKESYDVAGKEVHDINEKICFFIDGTYKNLSLMEYAFRTRDDLEISRLSKSPYIKSDLSALNYEYWQWYWSVTPIRSGFLPIKSASETRAISEPNAKTVPRP